MIEGSSRDGRMNYETAIAQLIRANYSPRDAMGKITRRLNPKEMEELRNNVNEDEITQSYLWMSSVIRPGFSVLNFATVDTQQISGSPVTPINKLLTMQDSFLISTFSYFLQSYTYAGNNNYQNPDFTVANNWEPITYTATWHNNGIADDIDPGMSMFWIGAFITLTVNKKVVTVAWDCLQHYKATITQYTPGFPVPSAYIPKQKSSYDGSTDGFVYMQPNIVIGGGRNNAFVLNLPGNIPATIAPFTVAGYNNPTGGFVFFACIVTRGILMQNSTTVK
jgi:hypothetical protein